MSGEDKDPKDQAEQPKFKHLGDLIYFLRTGAGLTRAAFGNRVRLSEVDVKSIETRRSLATRAQWNRIRADPAMAGLIELAHQEGIAIELANDVGDNGGR